MTTWNRNKQEAGRHTVHQFPAPIRRWTVAAFVAGWLAVRSELTLEEFLKIRLDIYHIHAPQDYPLPRVIGIGQDGETQQILNEAREPARLDDSNEAQARWQAGETEALRQQEARDLADAEDQLAHVTARLEEIRDNASEHKESLLESVMDGRVDPAATLWRSPKERGRPGLPSLNASGIQIAFLCLLLLTEAWAVGLAYANATGIDTQNLAMEWARQPANVVMAAAFAVCCIVSSFLIAHVLWGLIATFVRPSESWRAAVLHYGTALAGGWLVGATVWGVASMRDGASQGSTALLDALRGSLTAGSGGVTVGTFFLITLTCIIAGAYVSHRLIRSLAARQEARAAQHAWDMSQEARNQVRDRFTEADDMLAREQAKFEMLQQAARTRIRQISQAAADRELLRQQERDRMLQELKTREEFADAFCNALVAALAKDRFYFRLHEGRRRRTLPASPRRTMTPALATGQAMQLAYSNQSDSIASEGGTHHPRRRS